MPSASGYPGVRRHGKGWQAKDRAGVHGTFADPYEAACALAAARGKPVPARRPNAVECTRTTQQHTAALTTVLLAVPTEQMMMVLASALLAVEQERAQRAQPSTQPAIEVQPSLPPAVIETTAEAEPQAVVVPNPPPTANELRRDLRKRAIDNWWRSLWATGETFHLKIERSCLFLRFQKAETKRLDGRAAEYESMDGATFVKLLKTMLNKTDGEVQRRPAEGGNPTMWWEIDAAKYCPELLKPQWEAERERRRLAMAEAQSQLRARQEAARAEQLARDEQLALQEKEQLDEQQRVRDEEYDVRMAQMCARVDMSRVDEGDEEQEDCDDDYDDEDEE